MKIHRSTYVQTELNSLDSREKADRGFLKSSLLSNLGSSNGHLWPTSKGGEWLHVVNYDDCSESSDDNIGILLEIVTKRSAPTEY